MSQLSPTLQASHDVSRVDALKVELRRLMDKLPQRDLIQKSDADQWIGYMAHLMPEEAPWHMIRAGGVGGSEIGGLVRNYLNYKADHLFSAHDWALSKLLKSTPKSALGVLARGHAMEPIHAARFQSEHQAPRDHEAYEALKHAKSSFVWMRYSPDELVKLTKPTVFALAGGPQELSGRLLVDYKAPTSVDATDKVAFQYVCQLHQGAILCEENDIEITGTMLSQFDWATWSLKNDYVAINPELCDLIKEAGSHYWDYVMRGEIPSYIKRPRFDAPPDLLTNWDEAAYRYGQMAAMVTELTNAKDDLKEQILNGTGINELRLDGSAVVFPGAIKISGQMEIDDNKVLQALPPEVITTISVKETQTKYDEKKMLDRLVELGEDKKIFRKTSKLDPTLAYDALIERGLDPEDFMKQSVRFTVDTEVKKQSKEWYEQSFAQLKLPEPVKNPVDQALEERAFAKEQIESSSGPSQRNVA